MIIAIDRLTSYLIPCPSIDDSRFISGRRSTESGVSAASIYLHTQKARRRDRIRGRVHLRAPISWRSDGGAIAIREGEKERMVQRRRPRRAGSSTARSLEPQSSRTCLDAPWWLAIRARRCYFFRAATRPSRGVMLGHRPLHAAESASRAHCHHRRRRRHRGPEIICPPENNRVA